MVEEFLIDLKLDVPRGCNATVFREPELESGAPDVVIVIWNRSVPRRWPEQRRSLRNKDLRLAHLMYLLGPTGELELRRLHGAGVNRSLSALEEAAVVGRSGGLWETLPLARTFAVRQILVFEAKMNSWSDALSQATVNRWFASQSFALLPKLPTSSRFVEVAGELGVGVWLSRSSQPVRRPELEAQQPLSYASWLFNEWVWRIHQMDT